VKWHTFLLTKISWPKYKSGVDMFTKNLFKNNH